ncbi:hypothetical protein H4F38_15340 [Pectobacterium brasiliense]|uniref:hypothetical protein n=1 Tax=Pectobacterium brasiliense TaxID=180957 RepID=UPI00094A22DF|nr:hypothetical protein [Pectobacterium brasiliense]APS30717.1 hypothetical protein NC16_13690 [Pectobacterium brasiliense]MBN3099121.1 hypothetical protein [Pectobacterium brasiliense]MBN3103904.1 hypothetical protein [Pectobacterium brasiliense]MBN3166163.1 hypothetical protein [Pectobacterium brasiliense]
MGKKSREKRERRLAQQKVDYDFLPHDIPEFRRLMTGGVDQETQFCKSLEATRALLRQYKRLDSAIALSVSELWPANTGSPIKHIFAWCVLLELPCNTQEGISIDNYADFDAFTRALYAVLPKFTMLEDFSPEADWGKVKVRLGQDFVPMFYGSCIERTPDFVEAFRITYAHIPEAQTHMDLAIALQARIIESIPELMNSVSTEAQCAHVEVVSEDFWLKCNKIFHQLGNELANWRKKAGYTFDTRVGTFKAPLKSDAFGNAVMQGMALPFLAVEMDSAWIPMSVRSAPGLIIDHWANKNLTGVSPSTHKELAKFVAKRFQRVLMGPLTLYVDGVPCKDLPISCIIPNDSGLYLICACDNASNDRLSDATDKIYTEMSRGSPIFFRLDDGRFLSLSRDGAEPGVDELHIVVVVTLAGTAFNSINLPSKPTRLFPLADFITIFDSLKDLEELESYWKFTDAQEGTLSPFSRGTVDLFASFKDMHGVLVEGAIAPNFIGLDPHWGTSWRFKILTEFWSRAPKVFPDSSIGWTLSSSTEGVVRLESRHHKAMAYSTSIGSCTVQTLIEIPKELRFEDGRLIGLFAQLLADCSYRCRKMMSDVSLFRQPHVLFSCSPDPSSLVTAEESPSSLDEFKHVVTSVIPDSHNPDVFHVQVDTRAVLAGLNLSKDGSFEVRCLLETLEKCHAVLGLQMPDEFAQRFTHIASQAARYHLKVMTRNIDVPDYVYPIIPSPTDYKLARRRLAAEIMGLGFIPGRYELSDAKARIDPSSARMRLHIENRLAAFDRHQLLQAFIEQHDALLVTERTRIQRARLSLAHEVEYDRLDAIEQARKEFGDMARHYRYLLEKTVSLSSNGVDDVTEDVLRELVGLVDWFMVLTGASDTLHNGIDVGGVEIDDSYIPEVFYSAGFDDREAVFAREYAKSRLGLGANDKDAVEGESEDLLSSEKLKEAFITDLGFELQNMLTALAVLSQAQRYGFGDELSLSYVAAPDRLAQGLSDSIDRLDYSEAQKIVAFLTLSETGVRRLAGRDIDEGDIPYWERNKRIDRYTIKPLVIDGTDLRWGAESASRAMYIWMSAVRDGYLPAEFDWPHVKPVIRDVKESIEKRLELRTEEIFRRHTPYVLRGIDFFRRFRGEKFDDVGDFDVFVYWPEDNLLVTVECKYNQPPYTMKDSRRLRDRIFGKAENDKTGQFSRILGRRKFLDTHRSKLLNLLQWPLPKDVPFRNIELYVSRDVYYWMVHPPYPVPTHFVPVDTLDTWIRTELSIS